MIWYAGLGLALILFSGLVAGGGAAQLALYGWAIAGVAWFKVAKPARAAAQLRAEDAATARDIRRVLTLPVPLISDTTAGYIAARGLRVGEVMRHFDQQTSGGITGWLDHQLALSGWQVGLQTGRVGVGVGRLGIAGTSRVNLDIDTVSRANLIGDGWIAVLEPLGAIGGPDLVRLVVPSEAASLGLIQGIANAAARSLEASHPASASMVLACAKGTCTPGRTDISYCADRLAAMLRLPMDQRPPVTVFGLPLGEHGLLGGAIRFGSEDRVFQLIPFRLVERWLTLPGI